MSGEPTLLVLPHDGYSPLVPPFLLGPTDAWHNVGGLNFFIPIVALDWFSNTFTNPTEIARDSVMNRRHFLHLSDEYKPVLSPMRTKASFTILYRMDGWHK